MPDGTRSERAESFAALSVVRQFIAVNLSTDDESQRLSAALVSGNYFDLLGVTPAAGRFFQSDEDTAPGAHPVVVLSYETWETHFGGDLRIAGRQVVLNGQRFDVVGVAPRDFHGSNLFSRPALWTPVSMIEQAIPRRRGGW